MITPFGRTCVLVCLILGPIRLAPAQPAGVDGPKRMREVNLSFQSNPDIRNRVELTGPDAADWVKFERI